MILGLVLGPIFENSLRQSLRLYRSDLTAVFDSPIALAFLALTVIILVRAVRRV